MFIRHCDCGHVRFPHGKPKKIVNVSYIYIKNPVDIKLSVSDALNLHQVRSISKYWKGT